MLPVLLVALVATGGHREITTINGRTLGASVLPALLGLGSLTLYFTALKRDWVSRVYPLTELGPVLTFVLAVAFLHEPASPQRFLRTLLILAGLVLMR